ncbi:MAG: DNA-binding transcriptional MerR regulator [Candidatus Latescibacterota bacterium]|jgi:DNA-binding transcriptional MerR regulator
MKVKSKFSIKDLENLSNVKAHTIRIWEKRYGLLQPSRTETNIRTYDLESLKKLLNVSLLYNEGYKISKIAKLSDSEIHEIIKTEVGLQIEGIALHNFRKAMFEFDISLFNKTYSELMQKLSFSEVFKTVFIPLLIDIGQLWQTNTIDPTHESFISELMKQKIMLNIDQAQQDFKLESDILFSLFLPNNEIHEIGLLYAHYELIKAGYNTIYLGTNIPLKSLIFLLNKNENIFFLSYLTMYPEEKPVLEYINDFQNYISNEKSCNLWVMGPRAMDVNQELLNENIKIIIKIDTLLEQLILLKQS